MPRRLRLIRTPRDIGLEACKRLQKLHTEWDFSYQTDNDLRMLFVTATGKNRDLKSQSAVGYDLLDDVWDPIEVVVMQFRGLERG